MLLLVGSVNARSRVTDVIKSIPADGNPSRRTGEVFTCRIWVKDVLVALDESGEIKLPVDVGKSTMALLSKHLAHPIDTDVEHQMH